MKKIAVINDLSGFGKCSLSVALPIISVLGVQCVPLATAVFTSQTGFEHYYYTDLTDMITQYIKYWKINNASFDGIYTGYITDHKQAKLVSQFIDEFKKDTNILLVDPVMGDDGCTYKTFTNDLLDIHKSLTRRANIITPNVTEACLLADIPIKEILNCKEDTKELLKLGKTVAETLKNKALTNQEVIITGIKAKNEDDSYSVYNLVNSENKITYSSSPMIKKSFSGTGDLFASTIIGLKMKGIDTINAVQTAQNFISKSINDTPCDINTCEGIYFEKNLSELLNS